METYIAKLKHILPVFFIIAILTNVALLVFRWLFAIHFEIIDIKEDVWEFWLPICLPWIPVLIWLRPRFRILVFKKDNDNGRFFFQFLSAGTIIACIIVSQSFLTTATGKLQLLSNINEIDKSGKARYYKLNNFSVAPYYGGTYTDFRTSGKYGQYLNFDIFFATPILLDASERIYDIPKHWYGVKYQEQISRSEEHTSELQSRQ